MSTPRTAHHHLRRTGVVIGLALLLGAGAVPTDVADAAERRGGPARLAATKVTTPTGRGPSARLPEPRRAGPATSRLASPRPTPTRPAPTAPALTPTSLAPATSLFGSASVWRQDVSKAPLHPDSRAVVAELAGQVRDHWNGVAAFNDWDYSVGFYTAPAGTRTQRVAFYDCQKKGYVPWQLYTGPAHFANVPIPAGAVPAPGNDKNLTVWSPSTDQLWEFWVAERTSTGWRACWGGRIDRVSSSPGYFSDGMGTTATGLSHAGGMVRVQEVRAGRIDHAMSLNVIHAAAWWKFSYPAQRSDGWDPDGTNKVWEGMRFRLDPAVDVDSLGLHPVAATIARAAQKYGFIVNDKGGAVALVAENGASHHARTGVNPWQASYGTARGYEILRGFPWHRLQALPVDWGKP